MLLLILRVLRRNMTWWYHSSAAARGGVDSVTGGIVSEKVFFGKASLPNLVSSM
jgi:hypothetical protein